MTQAFGTIQYFDRSLRECPEAAIALMELVRLSPDSDRQVFRGMFAGTDKWSSRKRITNKNLLQLRTDVAAGVFDSLIALSGPQNQERFSIAIDVGLRIGARGYPYDFSLVADCNDAAALQDCERMSHHAFALLGAEYGVNDVDRDAREVQSELTAFPINAVGTPSDPDREERLFQLQLSRPDIGIHVRDAAWGNYLGSKLVAQLGGPRRVLAEAPAGFAEELENGAVYLRLPRLAEALGRRELKVRAAQLTKFFAPILLPSLRDT